MTKMLRGSRLVATATFASAVVAAGLGGAPAQAAGPFITQQAIQAPSNDARALYPYYGADGLQVATSDTGGAVLAWNNGTAPNAALEATARTLVVSVRAPGAPLTATQRRGFGPAEFVATRQVDDVRDPESGNKTTNMPPAIGMDAAGNVTVIWSDEAPSGFETPHGGTVYSRYRAADGIWEPTQSLGFYYYPNDTDVVPAGETVPPLPFHATFAADGSATVNLARGRRYERSATSDAFRVQRAKPDAVVTDAKGNSFKLVGLEPRVKPAGGEWALGATYDHDFFQILEGYSAVPWGDSPSTAYDITDDGVAVVALENPIGIPEPIAQGVQVWVRTPGTSFSDGNWTAFSLSENGSLVSARKVASGKIAVRFYDAGRGLVEALYPGDQQTVIDPALPLTPAQANAKGPVAVNASGAALRASKSLITPGRILGSFRPTATAAFGPDQVVIDPQRAPSLDYVNPAVGIDSQGNGYVAWVRRYTKADTPGGSQETIVGVTGFDPVAPEITGVALPTGVTSGTAAKLSATTSDRLSAVTVKWDFGDGATATGGSVSHTWAAPGTFTVRVTATDEAGNVTTTTRSLTVASGKLDLKPWMWATVKDGGITLARTVELYGAKIGDQVTFTCTGLGCDTTAQRAFIVSAVVAGKPLVTTFGPTGAGLSLSTGAAITVSVSRAGLAPQTVKWTMRSGAAPAKS